MSTDVHDEYCGSFGPFSDCPACDKERRKQEAIHKAERESRKKQKVVFPGFKKAKNQFPATDLTV